MSIYVRYIAEAITNKWLPDISAMQVFINRIQNILYAVDEALHIQNVLQSVVIDWFCCVCPH